MQNFSGSICKINYSKDIYSMDWSVLLKNSQIIDFERDGKTWNLEELFGYSENKTIKIRLIVIDQSNTDVSKVSMKPQEEADLCLRALNKHSLTHISGMFSDKMSDMFWLTLTSLL